MMIRTDASAPARVQHIHPLMRKQRAHLHSAGWASKSVRPVVTTPSVGNSSCANVNLAEDSACHNGCTGPRLRTDLLVYFCGLA
jgi:hypothetical protein